MMKRSQAIYIILGIVILLLVGWLAGRVGNVGIRRVQSDADLGLTITQPVIAGVPFLAHWNGAAEAINQDVDLSLRADTQTVFLARGRLREGARAIIIPCAMAQWQGSLVMTGRTSGEMLAWTPLTVLPAGPDCFQ